MSGRRGKHFQFGCAPRILSHDTCSLPKVLLQRLKKGKVNHFRHFLTLFRLTSELVQVLVPERQKPHCCCCSHKNHRAHPRSIQIQLSHVVAFIQGFAFQHCQNMTQATPERQELRNALYNHFSPSPLNSIKAFPPVLHSSATGFAELFADYKSRCSLRHVFSTFHSHPKPTEALHPAHTKLP